MPFKWPNDGSSRHCAIASFSPSKRPNQPIRELLERLNHRPFRKRDAEPGESVFARWTSPRSSRCRPNRFDMSEWSRARVNIDYHVVFDVNLYSVPYNLVHQVVEIRSTPTDRRDLAQGRALASHVRAAARAMSLTHQ